MDFWLFWPKFLKRTHFRAESRPIWNWNPPGGYGKEGQGAAVFLMARDIKNPSSFRKRGQTVKKPRRAREGRSHFELSIVPGGMYGGHGTVFASENPIFQRKNRFLAGSAPEKSSIFSGDWRGWQWRGSLLPRPPACQNFFDKLTPLPFGRGGNAIHILYLRIELECVHTIDNKRESGIMETCR